MESNKPSWQSKTVWLSLLTAVAPLIPGASEFLAQNPDTVVSGLGLLFLALRLITKGKVSIV